MILPLLIGIVVILQIAGIAILFFRPAKPAASASELLVALDRLEKNQERLERALRDESTQSRDAANTHARQAREELAGTLVKFNESLLARMRDGTNEQKNLLDTFSTQLVTLTQTNETRVLALTQSNEGRLDAMRATMEERLTLLQADNALKLEQMRVTVDEKLHATLEQRLGESFKQVSERLELVHKGLGEMQTLAVGVGDLRKVLTNVKTRGTWGEVQLENLLEQIMTASQYDKNVATKIGSRERVEFAVRLPGKDRDDQIVWVPIDSKFPLEDYHRLVDAQEHADLALIEQYGKALRERILAQAKDIRDKYIDPPNTTDFGILFLPVEGLYAEVLRQPGLADILQRDFKVMLTGPTTLAAMLNSLQMGFRTLAIEKRTSEVWATLSAVKTSFGKFGVQLDKVKKKLQEASNTVDEAASKSRTVQRNLTKVQELPAGLADDLLGADEPASLFAISASEDAD